MTTGLSDARLIVGIIGMIVYGAAYGYLMWSVRKDPLAPAWGMLGGFAGIIWVGILVLVMHAF